MGLGIGKIIRAGVRKITGAQKVQKVTKELKPFGGVQFKNCEADLFSKKKLMEACARPDKLDVDINDVFFD